MPCRQPLPQVCHRIVYGANDATICCSSRCLRWQFTAAFIDMKLRLSHVHLPWLTLLSFRPSLLQDWYLSAAEFLVKTLCSAGLKHASDVVLTGSICISNTTYTIA